MSIKVPSGPPSSPPIEELPEAPDGAAAVAEGDAAGRVAASDALTRIAEEVAAGRISGEEAVEQILAETLESPMVEQAPEELREELAAALRSLIETDPHLRSLARGLGAGDD